MASRSMVSTVMGACFWRSLMRSRTTSASFSNTASASRFTRRSFSSVLTGTSWLLYPKYTTVRVNGGWCSTTRLKRPSRSVTAPPGMSFTFTTAPIMASPVPASCTLPLSRRLWAWAAIENAETRKKIRDRNKFKAVRGWVDGE